MPWLTGSAIPSEEFCRVIRVPNDPTFIHAVSGALLELTYADNWEQFGTLTPEQQAEAFDAIYVEFTQSICIEPETVIYPKNFIAFPVNARVISSGSILHTVLATQQHDVYADITPVVVNNHIAYDILIAKGIWNFGMLGIAFNGGGTFDAKFNGTTFLNQDTYISALTLNLYRNWGTNVTVPTDGYHELSFKVVSKHPSSSGYANRHTLVYGKKVADLP